MDVSVEVVQLLEDAMREDLSIINVSQLFDSSFTNEPNTDFTNSSDSISMEIMDLIKDTTSQEFLYLDFNEFEESFIDFEEITVALDSDNFEIIDKSMFVELLDKRSALEIAQQEFIWYID